MGTGRAIRCGGSSSCASSSGVARINALVSSTLPTPCLSSGAHAKTSEEVRNEYETAMAAGKTVIPILLDGTPPAEALQQFQHLDFSELFVPRSPEGLSRSSHHLIQGLLVRLFPEVEPVWFVKPAANPTMD